jgi:hypothetical protein
VPSQHLLILKRFSDLSIGKRERILISIFRLSLTPYVREGTSLSRIRYRGTQA